MDRAVRSVVLQILVLNVLVAAAKAVLGWASGSLAVGSDAIHSLLDGGSNLMALVVLRLAAQPPDEGHPYGHRKMEILAAAAVGLLIAGASVRFAWSAVEALVTRRAPPSVGGGALAIMLGTLVVNLWVTWYEHRRGVALKSAFLIADAAHTGSDVWVTVAVIGSLVATWLRVPYADAVVALVVVGVIVVTAWRILGANLGILIDRAILAQEEVRTVALEVEGVVGVHRIRSRGVDGAVHLDLHLQADGDLSLRDAHGLSHRVEARLRQSFPALVDVTIHVEPAEDPEEGL